MDSTGSVFDRPMTRRDMLKTAGAGALAVAAGTVLPARGSSPFLPTTGVNGNVMTPKHGGTLTVGLIGGAASDTLDAQDLNIIPDWCRASQLYDQLVILTPDDRDELSLAEEFTPNADASVWTVRLRKGVEFHNGKELTADDVLYTFNRLVKLNTYVTYELNVIDWASVKKLDPYTVQIPCKYPFAVLDQFMSADYNKIIPVDYDPHKPVGTGPFMFESFTPGVQSTFVRNPNYWQTGLPYVDKIIIDDYSDSTSQINALLTGQANLIGLIPYTSIDTVKSAGKKVIVSPGTNDQPITMRCDRAPFDDVRVRQAMKLIVDRPEMLRLLYGDLGILGNDIFSNWDPSYDSAIPQRHQDLDQAKSLLKSAGQEGLTATIVTAEIAQGTNEMCEIFKQQALGAGVRIQLDTVTTTVLYDSQYMQRTFSVDEWFYYWYLSRAKIETLTGAPISESHFADPHYDALFNEAVRMLDVNKRTEIIHEMQMIDYNSGGLLIAYFAPLIDVVAENIEGVIPGKSGNSFNNNDFRRVWIS